MDIYSFEFGSKPVEWFYNEFKDMKFIGTSSRRFKSNRNFLRLDNSISKDDITFFDGTYYAPAIKIKGDLYLKELNRENQLFILNPSSRGEHSMLAFLVIDTKSYRLLSINAYNDIFTHGEDPENPDNYGIPYIAKVANTDQNRIAMIEFDEPINDDDIQIVSLCLYNVLFHAYEFYLISNYGNKLKLEEIKPDDIPEEDQKEIYFADKKTNFRMNEEIKTTMQIFEELGE